MGKKHVGSDFDDFLQDEGMLEEVTAADIKRVIAWQLSQEMKAQQITKTRMAQKMHTSRALLNRLLDVSDTSMTFLTMTRTAALGKTVRVELLLV